MAININVNGESINYPQTGDTNWSDEATDFAVQTASAFGKIGLSSGTTVDIPGTLDVTGNTTLDANLSVTGNATITGNLTANGNSNLGNASGDTISVTGILNVDSGVLYVDPTNNRVGINDTTPSQALDVTGNVAITGNETVGGTLNVTGATTLSSTLAVTGNLSVNGNATLGDASGDSLTINSNGVSIPNGLNFDSDTFVIDATNNRIGINDSTPVQALDVTGRIALKSSSGSGEAYINLGESSTGTNNWVYGSNGAGDLYFYNNTASASNQRLAIQSTGQIQAVVPGGTALYPGYLCRAWAMFNGGSASPITPSASGNISSITKPSTGNFTVNFINNMPDINYAPVINFSNNTSNYSGSAQLYNNGTAYNIEAPTVSSFKFSTLDAAPTRFNPTYISIAVFR